jgi:hypothetical protein
MVNAISHFYFSKFVSQNQLHSIFFVKDSGLINHRQHDLKGKDLCPGKCRSKGKEECFFSVDFKIVPGKLVNNRCDDLFSQAMKC